MTRLYSLYTLGEYSRRGTLIRLTDTSSQPLRQQIVCQIRELVLSGTLGEHAQLPSIRSLARQQRVGIVTVQRAFEDLEREGLIYARQGKGYYVARIPDEARRRRARELTRRRLTGPVREARGMGLRDREIETLVREILAAKGESRP